MKRFGKTVIKNWFINEVKDFIKSIDFKIGNDSGHRAFTQNSDYWLLSCYIEASYNIKNNTLIDTLSFSNVIIRIHKVENLLGKIINNSSYNEAGKTFSIFPNEEFGETFIGIEKQEDTKKMGETFKKVFLECFLPAFEKYSNPKNVLELWDGLDDEGKLKHFFDPYKNCKILILSKMCNDPKFSQRCEEEYNFYKKHYDNGLLSAKVLMDDCEKVIKYLENNEI